MAQTQDVAQAGPVANPVGESTQKNENGANKPGRKKQEFLLLISGDHGIEHQYIASREMVIGVVDDLLTSGHKACASLKQFESLDSKKKACFLMMAGALKKPHLKEVATRVVMGS